MNRLLSCLCLAAIGALMLAAPAAAQQPPAGVSGEGWVGIQRQIEVERHKITESDRPGRLFRADNPTQRFTAHFGSEDVVIAPRGRGEPAWELGLRLTAWGAAHDLQQVDFAIATAEDNRVEYRRGPLTEWYVNGTMGLEQGFTIAAPPSDDITELVLEMTLAGGLAAKLTEGGNAVTFRGQGTNSTTLAYSGLAAWDAVDAPLAARMELAGGATRLRLVIAVGDAAWPITVDPVFTQVAKLLPTPDMDTTEARFGQSVAVDRELMVVGINDVVFGDLSGAAHVFRRDAIEADSWQHVSKLVAADGALDDRFGYSVSISDDTVIIGALKDDDGGSDSGSAYIFQRNQGGPDAWGQVAKITAADGAENDHFGMSVAISGDTAIVGAKDDDDFGTYSGAAYVFQRDHGGPDAWGQVAKLTASDAAEKEGFGHSVSICEDVIVIGANGLANGGHYSGAAYVFRRDQGGPDAWGQVVRLVTSDPTAGGRVIGSSVSISGDTAVVGAHHDDIFGSSSGSAYVFQQNQGGPDSWGQVAKMTPDDGDMQNYFGRSVSISWDTAIIGAHAHGEYDEGAAYVFQRNQGGNDTWGQLTKVAASDGAPYDRFGISVSISEDTIVVGAPEDNDDLYDSGSVHVFRRDQGGPDSWGPTEKLDSPPVLSARGDHFGFSVAISDATIIVGTPGDPDNGSDSGAGYIFNRSQSDSGAWDLTAKVTASDGAPGDEFGTSVAISGDTAVVGAYLDDDNGLFSGSAFVFQRNDGGADTWGEVAKLAPPDSSDYDYFGISVAISGETILIGAFGDNSAHLFQQDQNNPGNWGHITKLDPYPYASNFGYSVAIRDDTAVVGAFGDNGATADSGSAYVYQRDHGGPSIWGWVKKIFPSDGASVDWFGYSVSLSGNTVLIGAPRDDDNATNSGSGYFFRRDQGGPDAWGQVAKITAADGSIDAFFGDSVGLSGDTAVVGAFDSIGPYLGSAYVFSEEPPGSGSWFQVAQHPTLGVVDNGIGASVAVSGSTVLFGAYLDNRLGNDSGTVHVFNISDAFFADGFETGDTSGWSVTVP